MAPHRPTAALLLLPVLAVLSLTACRSADPAVLPASGKSASLRVMEQIATRAHKCWFASGDEAFRPYRMANELDSYSGRPRFLLVPAGNFEGLPLLVVEASGPSGKVDVFGPLMQKSVGTRIAKDIRRWQTGSGSCTRE